MPATRLRARPWQVALARRDMRRLLRLIAATDTEVREAVLRASRDSRRVVEGGLPSEGVGARVRRAQYVLRRSELARIARRMWADDIPPRVLAGMARTSRLAVNAQRDLLQVLLRAAPAGVEELGRSFLARTGRMLEDLRSRLVNAIDLAPSLYKNASLMSGKVDAIVNEGILLGKSAREIAGDVVGHINPRVAGGQRYAALRLGRTELNNAFTTTSVRGYARSPYVEGVQWQLSGSHPRPDDCDTYAQEDSHGLGPGVFPTEYVPFRPHPACLCLQIPVTPEPDVFVDRLVAGEYG